MTEPNDETFRREVSVHIAEEGDGRTLVSRLVPYNETADVNDGSGAYKERFLPGAFKAQMRAADKIKAFLNFRHQQDFTAQIGHASSIEDRPDGLYGALRVKPGQAGDDALYFVREGLLSKLSIEFTCRANGWRRAADGVIERTNARLIGVALVPEGAYSSAEVLAVREEPNEPEQQTQVVALPAALDPDLVTKLQRHSVTVPADLLAQRKFSEGVWDGSPSRWADATAYARACLVDENPEGITKTKALCFLPILEPTGEVNIHAVRAAVARVAGLQVSDGAKARALRQLNALIAEYEER